MRRSAVILGIFWALLENLGGTGAICSTNKYEKGPRLWLKCSHSSLSEPLETGNSMVSVLSISLSNIPYVPDQAFFKFGSDLLLMSLHSCGIKDIHATAFDGMYRLKKLILSSNNITYVRPEWFSSLTSLEHLDLAYNSISGIDNDVFPRLANLKTLDLGYNHLTCLPTKGLEHLRSINKIRIEGNPMSLTCRAKTTRWLVDKGVNYMSYSEISENWLDEMLWMCGFGEPEVEESEILMKECVLLSLFNQLKSALTTSDSYAFTVSECVNERNAVASCLLQSGKPGKPITNGEAMRKLLLAVHGSA
ncbi:leucine-rich repeat transmembrane neuronal protein 4 [Orussus abietinus]|uniref:leucine-rich repeat transmembrane neuronal protein 4 n=1 Tax=Orussus abietinus TaxID=222816 RepID=UPI00062643C2|nr:leucine-rich repeat transmembrane neuronal protein 4 [Orussus abietinus]